MLKFVVTGTGRCGTAFLARYLTSLGINCSHEGFFTHDGIEKAQQRLTHKLPLNRDGISDNLWLTGGEIIAESSYMVAPYLDNELIDGAAIIHLMRNPLYILSSFHYAFNYFDTDPPDSIVPYVQFSLGHLQVPRWHEMHPLHRGCTFIMEWTDMIKRKCIGKQYILHCVENDINPVLDFVGNENDLPINDLPKNDLPRSTLQFSDIPPGEIRDKFVSFCKSYNYSYKLKFI